MNAPIVDLITIRVTERVSDFVASAATAELDAAVVDKTKMHVVDTVAAALSGTRLDAGRTALAALPSFAGAPEATVFGSRDRCPAVWAAMFNAMLAHADETDDSHESSKSHPGCGIVPSALAMAQRGRRTGLQALRAVAGGYDVGTRITEGLGATALNPAGTSTHAFCALFGSGAAAAIAAGFDASRARRLLSYLAHEASGLSCWMTAHDHVQKAWVFGGMGAKNAITAALLCEAGWTGLDDAIEGPRALLHAFGKPVVGRGLVEPFVLGAEVLRSNLKKWCVGSPVQAPLDALEAIGDALPAADDIDAITVEIRADEAFVVDDRDVPNICLQHLVALYVVDRGLTFESVHDDARLADDAVRRLRARVTLVRSDALQASGGRQAIVSIAAGGTTLRHHVRHVRGTWGDPMTRDEVDRKARDLLKPAMDDAASDRLLDGLWRLETLDAVELDRLLDDAAVASSAR